MTHEGCNIFVGTTLPYDVARKLNEVEFPSCLNRACIVRELIILGLEAYMKNKQQFNDGFD